MPNTLVSCTIVYQNIMGRWWVRNNTTQTMVPCQYVLPVAQTNLPLYDPLYKIRLVVPLCFTITSTRMMVTVEEEESSPCTKVALRTNRNSSWIVSCQPPKTKENRHNRSNYFCDISFSLDLIHLIKLNFKVIQSNQAKRRDTPAWGLLEWSLMGRGSSREVGSSM
jgi:hypothetical protein